MSEDLLLCIMRAMAGQGEMTAALFDGNHEVSVRGYAPMPMRNWAVDGDDLVALVTFGPCLAPFAFDRYALFFDGELIEWIPEESRVALPGGAFNWRFSYTDDRVGELRDEARALCAATA